MTTENPTTCVVCGLHRVLCTYYDRHPFQPAPTPAPPTPPATEERVTHGRHCRCTPCRREDWTNPNLAHCGMHGPSCPPVYAPIDLTPPATEPVAALLEAPGYSMFRQLRERSDMTLRAAAPRLGIDFTYLSKVENGHERPSDALVRKMGALYGFDAESMLVGRAAAEMPEPVRRRIIADALAAARAEVDVEALAEALDGLPYRDCEMWVNNDIPTIGFARDIAAAYLAARARRAGEELG